MPRPRFAAVAAGLAVTLTAVSCAGGEERAIRNQLSAIEAALTVPAHDGDLGRVTRLATLRKTLAPEIHVSIGSAQPGGRTSSELVGRDAVFGLASRWIPPAGGVSVEFVDVQVTLDESGTSAQVYCTARATSGPADRPLVDARELTVSFAKVDGEWLVTAVRPEETLIR